MYCVVVSVELWCHVLCMYNCDWGRLTEWDYANERTRGIGLCEVFKELHWELVSYLRWLTKFIALQLQNACKQTQCQQITVSFPVWKQGDCRQQNICKDKTCHKCHICKSATDIPAPVKSATNISTTAKSKTSKNNSSKNSSCNQPVIHVSFKLKRTCSSFSIT